MHVLARATKPEAQVNIVCASLYISRIYIISSSLLCNSAREGPRLNGFLGLSLNDRTIIFLVILLDRTVSEG